MMGVPADRWRRFRFAVLGIILLTVAIRLPSLWRPFPIDDEAGYSVIANEIVNGGRPYIDAVDRKPPLLYWTYSAVFEIAGKYNWIALHITSLTWTLATMAGLYVIGKELFDRQTGLIAALFYTVFQAWASYKNLAFNGEMVMNLAIVWAWAIGLRHSTSRVRPDLFLAGALLCAGFLLKQPAAIAAVPLGIYLLLPSYRASRGLKPTDSIVQAVMLTLGFLAVLSSVTIVLWKQGILHEAFYWTIIDHDIPHVFWQKGFLNTSIFIAVSLPLIVGALMSCRPRSQIWVGMAPQRTALLGLLAASMVGAAAGARFYQHYYIQLIPPLALLAAPFYARLWTEKIPARHWFLQPSITCAWLLVTVVAFSVSHWIGLAVQRKPLDVERYLLEHSAPNDRIFVWGQKTRIYLNAHRRPACRYILSFPLTGSVFGGPLPGFDTRSRILPGAWGTLQQDFKKHPPAYIVDLYSQVGASYPVRDFPILAKLLKERYELVAHTAEGIVYRLR